MHSSFPVFDVTDWQIDRSEPMGTKEKDWRINPNDGRRWLVKLARLMEKEAGLYAGEDWAEKLAAEVADKLGIPHAQVELAVLNGRPGVICLDFVDDPSRLQLVHGNELMYRKFQEAYPKMQKRRVFLHTVSNVMTVLSEDFIHLPSSTLLPPAVVTGPDVFAGYLLLDALIGNTDRHHENWAILEDRHHQEAVYATLSPTFDHASSLGRELTDDSRAKGLGGQKASLLPDAYSLRARSAFFERENDQLPVSPARVFQLGRDLRPVAAQAWLQRLSDCAPDSIQQLPAAMPVARMSTLAREFTQKQLICNRDALLKRKL